MYEIKHQMDNKYSEYQSYTVEELLQDDFFINSQLHPTKESDEFWEKAVRDKVVDLHEYRAACCFIGSVHVKKEPVTIEQEYALWEKIEIENKQNIRKKKRQLSLLFSVISGVAVVCALVLLVNVTSVSLPEERVGIESVERPDLDTKDIQLVLGNNKSIALEGKEADIAYNEEGIAINNRATSFPDAVSGKSAIYNQLIVPFGKRSMLTFAEGTKIWINAGSRVVYPVNFQSDKREIYVDGEVYLEVTEDRDRPFHVRTKEMSVKVLGTSFNVMAYQKDSVQNIVLVEGSVEVNSTDNGNTILSPNEMCRFINGEKEVKIVNVADYTSWISGIYQYESELLGTIVKRLSRYYGEDITCSPSVYNLSCSGKLDLKEDLQQLLNGITHTLPVAWLYNGKTYTITNL